SDAVLHWVWVSSQGKPSEHGIPAWCTPADAHVVDYVGQAADQTGGEKHKTRFGDPAVKAFSEILDEFRRSYVLRDSPAGVSGRGWHRVRVDVPGQPTYTIKARSGYFGG